MSVRCRFCEFENGGFCLKKKRAGKPVKIEVNKKRSCGLFSEDSFRVLVDYRKREAHEKKLRALNTVRTIIHNSEVNKSVEE